LPDLAVGPDLRQRAPHPLRQGYRMWAKALRR
jgi:hypothetical protein